MKEVQVDNSTEQMKNVVSPLKNLRDLRKPFASFLREWRHGQNKSRKFTGHWGDNISRGENITLPLSLDFLLFLLFVFSLFITKIEKNDYL